MSSQAGEIIRSCENVMSRENRITKMETLSFQETRKKAFPPRFL